MNKEEQILFDQYKQLHAEFYAGIQKQKSYATMQLIYSKLQEAWKKYMLARDFK